MSGALGGAFHHLLFPWVCLTCAGLSFLRGLKAVGAAWCLGPDKPGLLGEAASRLRLLLCLSLPVKARCITWLSTLRLFIQLLGGTSVFLFARIYHPLIRAVGYLRSCPRVGSAWGPGLSLEIHPSCTPRAGLSAPGLCRAGPPHGRAGFA